MRVKAQRAHWQSRWTDCNNRHQWYVFHWNTKDYQRYCLSAQICVSKYSENIIFLLRIVVSCTSTGPWTYLCTYSYYFHYFPICSFLHLCILTYAPLPPATTQDNIIDLVCTLTDLVSICKDVADRDIRKQVSSIKTDSEKKCGINLDRMHASPLSGKNQFVVTKMLEMFSYLPITTFATIVCFLVDLLIA